MRLAAMQPYLFPYIGYFQAIDAVDRYVLYSNVSYIKKGWINRNRLLARDGSIITFTVPVANKSSFTLIKDTEIDNSEPWARRILKTIQTIYGKRPFFEETYPMIEKLLRTDYRLLKDLNSDCITSVAKHLEINTDMVTDNHQFDEMEKCLEQIDENFNPYEYLSKTHPTRKVSRVIEMCRHEACNEYVNAIGGQDMYKKEEFAQYGISLSFVKTNEIVYSQGLDGKFEPNLSIIDVLMNNGKEETKRLIKEYTLI